MDQRRLRRPARGQATVELALLLPVLLLVTLGVIQLALLFATGQLARLAAWQGARAALVGEDPARAAQRVLAPALFVTEAEGRLAPTLQVPGWGPLPRSGAAQQRTQVVLLDEGDEAVGVELTHDCLLLFPLGGIFNLLGPGGGFDELWRDAGGREYLRLQVREVLPRPWTPGGLP